MATEVLMPKQGQSVETCLILKWRKKEGEAVKAGEVLVEVETDKATFEVEAPADGVLLKTYFKEGEDVPVLTRIATIGRPGELETAAAAPAAPPPAAAAPGAVPPAAPGAVPSTRLPARSELRPASSPQGRLRISPRARKLAAAEGLAPDGLQGSGPKGRILERDVRAALQARPVDGAAATAAPVEEIPLRGVRKVIAARMLESITGTAQYSLHAFASAEALQAYRERLKASPEGLGLRGISLNDLVMFAVARVLLRYRDMNSHFLGDRILRFAEVHLGFAVDTPRGLMVPVIRGASGLSLRALAGEARRLAQACLEGKATPDDLAGATFTVSNLGALGIESFTPILNPPQVAILGVGGVQLRPVQRGGAVAFVPSLALSLTANHQVVDGAPGARFLKGLREVLESFDLLLAD